jgi:hypothetical protein
MATAYPAVTPVAPQRRVPHYGGVGTSYSYAVGPLTAFIFLGLMILLLRWAFRRGVSVVAAPPRPGQADDYGLLVPISTPPNYVEGEMLRRRLEDAGIRATLAQTLDGPRIMVWPGDEARARARLGTR